MSSAEVGPLGFATWILVASLAVPLLLGRVLLAFLPPGRIGGHSFASLPTTLAASVLVGVPAASVIEWYAAALGLGAVAQVACVAALALLLALVWLASAPQVLVPGEGPREVPSRGVHLALRWACAAAIAARFVALARPDGEHPDEAWIMSAGALVAFAVVLAAVLLIDHALVCAESRARERSLVWVLLVALLWRAPDHTVASWAPLAVLFSAGASGLLVGWWRCADARACALAALSSCALISMFPRLWWLGALALALLIAGTPAGGRCSAAVSTGVWLVLFDLPVALHLLPIEPGEWSWLPWTSFATDELELSVMVTTLGAPLAILALGLLLAWGRPRGRTA